MTIKAHAIDKRRTHKSLRIEGAIEALTDLLNGDRNAVILTLLEIMYSDSEYSAAQRQEIGEYIKRMLKKECCRVSWV